MRLTYLRMGKAHVEYPDRWTDGSPLENFLTDGPEGGTVVRHESSEESHIVTLAMLSDSELYGDCSCKGFEHNPGPCRHLCATYRAWTDGLVSLPTVRPTAIIAEQVEPKVCRTERVV